MSIEADGFGNFYYGHISTYCINLNPDDIYCNTESTQIGMFVVDAYNPAKVGYATASLWPTWWGYPFNAA